MLLHFHKQGIMTFSCSLSYFEPSTKFYDITQHLTTFIVILAQVCIFSPILYPPIVSLETLQDMQMLSIYVIQIVLLVNLLSLCYLCTTSLHRLYDIGFLFNSQVQFISVSRGRLLQGVRWLFGIINQ